MSEPVNICPICSNVIESTEQRVINAHIDECLTNSFLSEGGSGGGGNLGGGGDDGGDLPIDMDAVLARELAQGPGMNVDSYRFTCPYPACNMSVVSYDFYSHAQQYHTACSQQLGCPICQAESGVAFNVSEKTNLLQHLKNAHADMSEIQRAMEASRQAFFYQASGRVDLPEHVGHGRTVKVLDADMGGKECSICFEEFLEGDRVAWLECFCFFHEACIDAWFEKTEKEICPVHRDEEDI